jgi:hypothetical protein
MGLVAHHFRAVRRKQICWISGAGHRERRSVLDQLKKVKRNVGSILNLAWCEPAPTLEDANSRLEEIGRSAINALSELKKLTFSKKAPKAHRRHNLHNVSGHHKTVQHHRIGRPRSTEPVPPVRAPDMENPAIVTSAPDQCPTWVVPASHWRTRTKIQLYVRRK